MGGKYEKGIYNQLIEVMEKLEIMEAECKKYRKEIKSLNSEVKSLKNENARLKEELARVKAENIIFAKIVKKWQEASEMKKVSRCTVIL